ncbi:MAG: protease complex subunit PrcB family protein [Elusimicrobia bacterium]|nr:protease complex subunit PrcB family protein [Candidatus Liberimonas magnetica]
MNCENIQDLLQLYIDNKLDAETKMKIAEHIKQCKECSQFLNEFNDTIETLGKLKEVKLPADYYSKLSLKLADVRKEPINKQNRLFKPTIYIPALCVFTLIICLGYFVNSSKKNVPESKVELKGKLVLSKQKNEKLVFAKIRENKINDAAEPQSIAIKRTVEIAKIPEENNKQFILRGAGAKYTDKKIIQEWQGINSGMKDKKTILINDNTQWLRLMKESQVEPVLPEMDFTKYMVIATSLGEQKTGGYSIHISKIRETEEKLYIDMVETHPKQGTAATQQLTRPYHIVVIDKD